MNVFCIVGQIERLPVLKKETSTGLKTCEVELKVIRPFSNSEGEFENDYITVEVWRGLAGNNLPCCRSRGLDQC